MKKLLLTAALALATGCSSLDQYHTKEHPTLEMTIQEGRAHLAQLAQTKKHEDSWARIGNKWIDIGRGSSEHMDVVNMAEGKATFQSLGIHVDRKLTERILKRNREVEFYHYHPSIDQFLINLPELEGAKIEIDPGVLAQDIFPSGPDIAMTLQLAIEGAKYNTNITDTVVSTFGITQTRLTEKGIKFYTDLPGIVETDALLYAVDLRERLSTIRGPDIQQGARQIAKEISNDLYTITFLPFEKK